MGALTPGQAWPLSSQAENGDSRCLPKTPQSSVKRALLEASTGGHPQGWGPETLPPSPRQNFSRERPSPGSSQRAPEHVFTKRARAGSPKPQTPRGSGLRPGAVPWEISLQPLGDTAGGTSWNRQPLLPRSGSGEGRLRPNGSFSRWDEAKRTGAGVGAGAMPGKAPWEDSCGKEACEEEGLRTLTQTLTHTHFHTHMHTLTLTHTLTLMRAHLHTCTFTWAHSHTFTLTHTGTDSHRRSLAHALQDTLTWTHSHTLSHSDTHAHIHTFTHSLSHSYIHTCVNSDTDFHTHRYLLTHRDTHTFTLIQTTHSHRHSLTLSLSHIHSHTHKLGHRLSHLLAHSHRHSLRHRCTHTLSRSHMHNHTLTLSRTHSWPRTPASSPSSMRQEPFRASRLPTGQLHLQAVGQDAGPLATAAPPERTHEAGALRGPGIFPHTQEAHTVAAPMVEPGRGLHDPAQHTFPPTGSRKGVTLTLPAGPTAPAPDFRADSPGDSPRSSLWG